MLEPNITECLNVTNQGSSLSFYKQGLRPSLHLQPLRTSVYSSFSRVCRSIFPRTRSRKMYTPRPCIALPDCQGNGATIATATASTDLAESRPMVPPTRSNRRTAVCFPRTCDTQPPSVGAGHSELAFRSVPPWDM